MFGHSGTRWLKAHALHMDTMEKKKCNRHYGFEFTFNHWNEDGANALDEHFRKFSKFWHFGVDGDGMGGYVEWKDAKSIPSTVKRLKSVMDADPHVKIGDKTRHDYVVGNKDCEKIWTIVVQKPTKKSAKKEKIDFVEALCVLRETTAALKETTDAIKGLANAITQKGSV